MLNNTRIATKVILGFLLAIAVALVIGIVGRQSLARTAEKAHEIARFRLPAISGIDQMIGGQQRAALGQRGLINRRMMDAETRQANYAEVAAGLRQLDDGRRLYEPLPQTAEETVAWKALLPALDEWRRYSDTIVELSRQKDVALSQGKKLEDPEVAQLDDRAMQQIASARNSRNAITEKLEAISVINQKLATLAANEADATSAAGSTTILLTLLLGLLLVAAIAILVSLTTGNAIKALIREAQKLSTAAVAGELGTRGDPTTVPEEFRPIVVGVNSTLDAVIGPLNVAAKYVDSISRGDIPQKITDSYNGDFNTIKNNLNQCVEAVNILVADARALSQAAVEGKLSTRADATRHQGDFRVIVEGVNKTLDAVIDPVMEATQVLESLARYDLRVRVNGNYSGDHARIKEALNGTARALHDALSQVSEAVEQVSEASKQIAVSSQSVAQGASEQASSLEETSSSLEEMSSMTKQNADNTVQARSLAQTTKEAAEKGGKAMTRMIDAMEKIQAASEGTSQIIKDINDIAFQTNLLALNAAVEAARAGDAGRGFAVVAEEVRNLALRSKEAAKKTEDLIRMSVGHAENGRVISGEVAGSLTEIVTAAGKVNDIVSEIAVASQEQSRGIEQVNTAVSEMDKVVQVAAANAEESSSAAEELSSQSEELTGLVSRFQLEREGTRRQARREAVGNEARRRASIPAAPRRPAQSPMRGRGAQSLSTARKLSPEDIIPLGDPEFRDF